VISDVQFIEAPLPPPRFPSWFKLPPKYWGAVARFWWHAFDHHEGQETRAEAEARAARVAAMLIERAETGEDVLVLAHGYFNHMVGACPEGPGLGARPQPGLQILVTASLRAALRLGVGRRAPP
jgi:hypothetical protein